MEGKTNSNMQHTDKDFKESFYFCEKVRKEVRKMEKLLEYLKYIVAIIGTGLTWLFGAWDMALTILIVFMILDYITGILKGYVLKELSSDIGLKGLARKAVILVVLIVAVMF